jgi:hypothetical protein
MIYPCAIILLYRYVIPIPVLYRYKNAIIPLQARLINQSSLNKEYKLSFPIRYQPVTHEQDGYGSFVGNVDSTFVGSMHSCWLEKGDVIHNDVTVMHIASRSLCSRPPEAPLVGAKAAEDDKHHAHAQDCTRLQDCALAIEMNGCLVSNAIWLLND